MMTIHNRWTVSREIARRIQIEGELTLESPAHFGNGDITSITDMPIARDAHDGSPLLTGASIAGALRSYLGQIDSALANDLFGSITGTTALESALIVHDAYGSQQESELRDGVAISLRTRTAEANKKYDFEVLPAGTSFHICFELALRASEESLIKGLALALRGLERGDIGLGKRKTRGFGQCKAGQWRVRSYDMGQADGLVGWLNNDTSKSQSGDSIVALLDVGNLPEPPAPDLVITATFALESNILIRTEQGVSDVSDKAHLHSRRNGKPVPVISGTSLAGVLRARAWRIANSIAPDAPNRTRQLIDGLFGPRILEGDEKAPELRASRLRTKESAIDNARTDLVQNRVRIDRFTGGSFHTALFSQQPAFGGDDTQVTLCLEVRGPQDQKEANDKDSRQFNAETGLLLLLLKDLWTSDLPIGGESSVGRGRLTGHEATVKLGTSSQAWKITRSGNGLRISDGNSDDLEAFVKALHEYLKEASHA